MTAVVLLLAVLAGPVQLGDQPRATTAPAPPPPWHIVRQPAGRVSVDYTVSLRHPAAPAPLTWAVLAPGGVEVPGQRVVAGTLAVSAPGDAEPLAEGARSRDPGPVAQPWLLAEVGDERLSEGLDARWQATVELWRSDRRPGPGPRVSPLGARERNAYLAATPTLDWDAPAFQAYLDAEGLRRWPGEADWAFGERIYAHLLATKRYDGPVGRPSEVCARAGSDCGGLAMLYAGILRASGVPARTLWGRWALSEEPDYGQWHVKAEFWAEHVGWVPVELAGALTWDLDDPLALLGTDGGDFVTFHIDPDLAFDLPTLGPRATPWSQFLLTWCTPAHPAPLEVSERWTVEREGE